MRHSKTSILLYKEERYSLLYRAKAPAGSKDFQPRNQDAASRHDKPRVSPENRFFLRRLSGKAVPASAPQRGYPGARRDTAGCGKIWGGARPFASASL